MQSKAATVEQYLATLPADRRSAIQAVRETILANLGEGYAEGMQYGMIGYCVPHRIFPAGYHCDPKQPLPFAGLASQKNYMAVYLNFIYNSPDEEAWFREAWRTSGKKLDMGKCCIRFKKLEDIPLEVIGEAVRRLPVKSFIASYERAMAENAQRRAAAKGAAGKGGAAGKKPAVRKKAAGAASSPGAGKGPAKSGKAAAKKPTTAGAARPKKASSRGS